MASGRTRLLLLASLGLMVLVGLDQPLPEGLVLDPSSARSLTVSPRSGIEAEGVAYERLRGTRRSREGASVVVAAGRSFVKGHLIVAFRSEVEEPTRREVLRGISARTIRAIPGDISVVELGGDLTVTEARRVLSRRPEVRFAEPDLVYRAARLPNDSFFDQQWSLHNPDQIAPERGGADIDAPLAWDTGSGVDEVAVGVIDTGVAYDHPDLDGNIWTNPAEAAGTSGVDDDGNGYVDDIRGWDWVDDDSDPLDQQGHGTHVAGTIGAEGNNRSGTSGVNWNVSIMPLRVLDAGGSGSTSDVAAAFAYAARAGARIVNASLSGSGRSQALDSVISAYPETLFVVAAGNEASDNDVTPVYPCNYSQPNVLCVGATTRDDSLASFSNYGDSSVDLAAPGTRILSTLPSIDGVLTERFETLSRWTGTEIVQWAIAADAGGNYVTDSPVGPYAPAASSKLSLTDPIPLEDGRRCSLSYALKLDTEPRDDVLNVEVSDGRTWVSVGSWSGSTSDQWIDEAGEIPFEGSVDLRIRFRLASDSDSMVGDGAAIDDVSVVCTSSSFDGTEYAFYSGTSMATPHVAGAAALLLAIDPGSTATELADLIVSGADPIPGLNGKLRSAVRLDLAGSLRSLSPIATSPSMPVGVAPTLLPNAGGIGGYGASPTEESLPSPTATPAEPAPSPSSSERPETVTERAVSLRLRRHLVAKGRVGLSSGGDTRCRANVVVQILRRAQVVREAVTESDGSYRIRVGDRGGKYRARLREVRFEDGVLCSGARSPWRRHAH